MRLDQHVMTLILVSVSGVKVDQMVRREGGPLAFFCGAAVCVCVCVCVCQKNALWVCVECVVGVR